MHHIHATAGKGQNELGIKGKNEPIKKNRKSYANIKKNRSKTDITTHLRTTIDSVGSTLTNTGRTRVSLYVPLAKQAS